MDIQRLRNLTTGKLHTNIGDIYADIEWFIGEEGIMTHQLPAAYTALLPFLKTQILEERFWDNKYDPMHTGEQLVVPLTANEQKVFWKTFTLS